MVRLLFALSAADVKYEIAQNIRLKSLFG